MIEFKSECGHTVRARDEDAGKKVRCSYCGQEASVPGHGEDDLDFLLADAEDLEAGPTVPKRPGRRRRPGPFTRRRRDSRAFEVGLRFVYAVVLVGVIVIVSKKLIVPYFFEPDRGSRAAVDDDESEPGPRASSRRSGDQRHAGLMGLGERGGLYLASFPSDADAFYTEASAGGGQRRVADVTGCNRVRTDASVSAREGVYTVEVVLPWNAPSLTRYPDYNSHLRRKLENAGDAEEQDRIVGDYFRPDGASDVFVSRMDDQIYIVRRFEGVRARTDRWAAVYALFIPASLAVEEVRQRVDGVAPRYTFDQDYVRSELAYYSVPTRDRYAILDVLARIGVMPYVTEDPQTGVKRTRLFKIGIEDGMFAAPVLRVSPP